MNTRLPLIAAALVAGCGTVFASTEYGTVVATQAVLAQVTVPRQQCTEQQALVAPRSSGSGALLGALVGGVVGHGLGEGLGRAAATGLGAVAGSVIGDRAEAANTPADTVPVRSCQTVNTVENRVVGYDVTYDYNGQRYTTRLAQDPGARIALDVTVVPQQGTVATSPVPVAALPVTSAVVVPSAVTVYPVPVLAPVVHPAYLSPYGPRVDLVLGAYGRHGH